MPDPTQTTKQQIHPSTKGVVIAGGTTVFAPIVPWLWNMYMPDKPMTPEVAAASAGAVVLILGVFYNIGTVLWHIVRAILKKYGINPDEGDT